MSQRTCVPLILALVFIAGCATSSVQFVPQPDLGEKLSDPDLVRIYIIRGGDLFAESKKLFVADADNIIGAVGRGGYLCWERPATITQLKYYLDSGARPTGETEGITGLGAEPGKTYYLEVTFPLGRNRMETKHLMEEYGAHLISEMEPAPVETWRKK